MSPDRVSFPSMASRPLLRNAANTPPGFRSEIRDLVKFHELLWALIYRDLTVRYKRSVLGFLWTFLNPLLLMVVLTIVFSSFFAGSIRNFESYFLSGFIAWNFFAQTTTTAMTSMAWNGQLLKRIRVPRSIFAVSIVGSGLANLIFSLVPLVAIMLVRGVPLRPSAFFLPVTLVILSMFCLGVSLGLSAIAVYFDDVGSMYQVGLTGLMYLTPIFYPRSIVPEKYIWLIKANPLTKMVELVRAPIYGGYLPSLQTFLVSTALAVASLTIGWLIFRRLSPGFATRL